MPLAWLGWIRLFMLLGIRSMRLILSSIKVISGVLHYWMSPMPSTSGWRGTLMVWLHIASGIHLETVWELWNAQWIWLIKLVDGIQFVPLEIAMERGIRLSRSKLLLRTYLQTHFYVRFIEKILFQNNAHKDLWNKRETNHLARIEAMDWIHLKSTSSCVVNAWPLPLIPK